jgi:hypothetical protein
MDEHRAGPDTSHLQDQTPSTDEGNHRAVTDSQEHQEFIGGEQLEASQNYSWIGISQTLMVFR